MKLVTRTLLEIYSELMVGRVIPSITQLEFI